MKHREIQSAHEKAVLETFSQYLKEKGDELDVVDRPDPPDAIVEINGVKSWIEITDAFQSPDWAESMTSYAADDKTHRPYQSRVICGPDDQAYSQVKKVIDKKLKKPTMISTANTYGPGILLVGAYTPLTSIEEIIELSTELITEIDRKPKVFRQVYLYQNTVGTHRFGQLYP